MAAPWAEGNKRKVTAMATVGDTGASYSIYEKNWICPQCKMENYASRFKCNRCRARKPEGTDNIVADPVLQQTSDPGWREAIDPATQHLYYYHTVTGETKWERPQEMGHAPHASGWFGRGAAGQGVEEYKRRNKLYLSRPARKQKEHIEANRSILEGANEFNIWYGKYLGEHWNSTKGRIQAESRCDVEKDAGWTRADKSDARSSVPEDIVLPMAMIKRKIIIIMSSHRDEPTRQLYRMPMFFCIHFARGMCARGHECLYFHRIPTIEDDSGASELHDCFGRERHAKHRDDMDGVGSFTNPSRTLYVGGVQKSTYTSQEELEKALRRHFGEWGEVEHLNFVPRLSVAFIRYRLRTNTEFAKEAMSNQSLDGDECLNIKWAYDDPNPVAKDAIKRADHDAAIALLEAQGVSLQHADYEVPADYQLPPPKGIPNGVDAPEYPDTDAQYPIGAVAEAQAPSDVPSAPATAAPPVEAQPLSSVPSEATDPSTTGDGQSSSAATADVSLSSTAAPPQVQPLPLPPLAATGWMPVWDARYQAWYYHNTQTGETSWVAPTCVAPLPLAPVHGKQPQNHGEVSAGVLPQQALAPKKGDTSIENSENGVEAAVEEASAE